MAKMLAKQAPWAYGCDCSQCLPRRARRKRRQVARRRERRDWTRDLADDSPASED